MLEVIRELKREVLFSSSILKKSCLPVTLSVDEFPYDFYIVIEKQLNSKKKKKTLILQILIFHIQSGILKNNEKEATFILVVMHLHGINYMIKPPDIYKLSSTF